MAKIPRQATRTVLPTAETAGVIAPQSLADTGQGIEARGLGALAGGVDQLASSLEQIELAEGASQSATSRGKSKTEMDAWEASLRGNNDETTYDASFDKTIEEIKTLRPKNATGGKRYDQYLELAIPQWRARKEGLKLATREANMEGDLVTNVAKAVQRRDLAEANLLIEEAETAGIITPKQAANALLQNEKVINEFIKEDAIEGLKPELVAATETGDKQDGLSVLRSSVNKLVESGILTEAEGAETDKLLGDWLDNFVAGREKKAKNAVKLTTSETYNDLMPDIVSGDLVFNDIDDSAMLKDDKEKWRGYITGSYEDAPTETTAEGQALANEAIWDAMTLQTSPVESYDELLRLRFTERSITDDQFELGVKRINNPYKKDTSENLKEILKVNTAEVRAGFNTSAEEERLVNSNAALIQWVDDQLADGKTPTKKEMNAMASQFRVRAGTLVDIGQIVERGGSRWEVVGFDGNGEPMVEEAE